MSGLLKKRILAALLTALTLAGTMTGTRPAESAPPERFAMLVGIDHYRVAAVDTLHAPGNDVSLMSKLLVERYGFLPDPAHMLVLTGLAATRSAILGQIEGFLLAAAKAHPQAEIVFFYSGHGSLTFDGLHQTLLASDARTPGVSDIRDDELSDLFDKLREYTKNITFVFDSCYSSTLIKAVGRSLVARSVPPPGGVVSATSPSKTLAVMAQVLSKSGGQPNDEYVAITAALPTQIAYEDCLPMPSETSGSQAGSQGDCPSGEPPYGILTYHLYQTLVLAPNQSYHDAINSVVADIAGKYQQHPTVQGAIGRTMLGGIGSQEDPYFKLVQADGNKLTVAAGRVVGVDIGSLLAIYAHSTSHLEGADGLLADAHVTHADDFTAEAVADKIPAGGLPPNSKVTILAIGPASSRLRVRVPTTLDGFGDLATQLRGTIAQDPLLSLTDQDWDLTVAAGCVRSGTVADLKDGCPRSVYLATPDQNAPLFGSVVESGAPDVKQKLIDIIEHRAKQRAVKALANPRSTLAGLVELRVVSISVRRTSDGSDQETSEQVLDSSIPLSFKVGDNFRLQIHNGSTSDIEAVLLDLGTSGTVCLLSPRGAVLHIPAGATYTSHRAWSLSGPPGVETFEMVAYESRGEAVPPDFSVLELCGANGDHERAVTSPLSWLAALTSRGAGARDVAENPHLAESSWTTDRLDALVTN